jgi:hypothetical protein
MSLAPPQLSRACLRPTIKTQIRGCSVETRSQIEEDRKAEGLPGVAPELPTRFTPWAACGAWMRQAAAKLLQRPTTSGTVN